MEQTESQRIRTIAQSCNFVPHRERLSPLRVDPDGQWAEDLAGAAVAGKALGEASGVHQENSLLVERITKLFLLTWKYSSWEKMDETLDLSSHQLVNDVEGGAAVTHSDAAGVGKDYDLALVAIRIRP